MQRIRTTVAVMALWTLGGVLAQAEVPRLIPYQGFLADPTGDPLPGPVDLTVTFYDAANAGAVLFQEDHPGVPLQNGVFAIDIGSETTGGLPDAGLDATEVWLGLTVDGGTELTPRVRLGMVPFSAKSRASEVLVRPDTFTAAVAADGSGNVGVGTQTPLAPLHVESDGKWSPDVGNGWGDLSVTNGTVGLSIGVATGGGGTGDVRLWTTGGTERLIFTTAALGDAMAITEGRLGIGTLSPTYPLYVIDDDSNNAIFAGGTVRISKGLNTTGPGLSVSRTTSGSPFFVSERTEIDGNALNAHGGIFGSGDRDLILNDASAGDVLMAGGGGNVGIGTSSPVTRLHIEGGSDVSLSGGGYITLGSVTGANIALDGNEIMARNNGATSPLYLNNDGGETWLSGALRMRDTGELSMFNEDGTVETVQLKGWEASGQGAELRLRNLAGTTTIEIDADFGGDGRIITQELQITGGSDLSEQFDIHAEHGKVEPGMVVSIDPQRPGKLRLSTRAYDPTVAGVVSGAGGVETGLYMGQKGSPADGKHPVALTGRVYCFVDGRYGAVRPGDLLTTSDTPGHAMKVTDHDRARGAIIGKAMTSLEKGEKGLVLVLVSLQ